MRLRPLALAALGFLAAACSAPGADVDDAPEASEDEVRVDTRSPEARRQYDANVAFALGYTAQCKSNGNRPRVLVTGFGRFMSIGNNATGRIVSTLVPDARYPETEAPASGEVDPPGPQLSVATKTIEVEGIGPVDVCGMVLPVYWDLAAILIAKEVAAFDPAMVLMNGVAGGRQPLWLEMGALNRAAKLDDGSNQLRPAPKANEDLAKIIESAPKSEDAHPNLLSWRAVERGAREAIRAHADAIEDNTRFGALLPDVKLAGYPRTSNTYLCNNVTYVTSWLMSHPNREVRLLRASTTERNKPNEVRIKLAKDFSKVPRVFVHWPSELATKHHAAGADVMKAIFSAQLLATKSGDLPVRGDNTLADPTLAGGDTF